GNLEAFGELMNASHDSLRDDYQVSCLELDTLVDSARSVDGVYGSRMTGAGFGGCTVSMVDAEAVDRFKEVVGPDYRAKTGLRADFFVCNAAGGACREV